MMLNSNASHRYIQNPSKYKENKKAGYNRIRLFKNIAYIKSR